MSFKKYLSVAILLGGMTMTQAVQSAYVVPINSRKENGEPNIMLLIEAEITRWQQDALKYQEMLYTDLVGKVGGGSLGDNDVISQMKESARDGANIIGRTTVELGKVTDLSNYATAKQELEKYYLIRPEYGKLYSEDVIRQLKENQRIAVNDLAVGAIAQAAVNTVGASVSKSNSEKEVRSKEIAKAKDVNAMMEMMIGMDRQAYEKMLQISATEAADAGVQAMVVLKGLSATGQYSSGEVEK